MLISGGYNVVAQSSAPAAAPAEAPAAKTALVHYDDLAQALSLIIGDQVKVVSFGALPKKEYSNLPSPLASFNRQALPLLKQKGFSALVLADLPSSSAAETEAAHYPRQKQFGPELTEWYSFAHDYCGITETFRQAQALGLSLHGVAANNVQEYLRTLQQNAWPVKARTLRTVDVLLGQGKSVVTYHELTANDVAPPAKKADSSFGWELKKRLNAGYVEIDLIQPELVPAAKGDELIGVHDWQKYIPAKGVNLLRFKNGRQVVILPRFNGVRQEQRAVKQPVCE